MRSTALARAGPLVNEMTAFTCAAFWDGVNQISSDVAKLPLNLHIRRKDAGSDVFVGAKAHKLMKYSPNAYTRSMEFRRTITMHALVYGNGYAEIVRDLNGQPASLWIIEPWTSMSRSGCATWSTATRRSRWLPQTCFT
jgi:phage portal protein BeeE